jgi:phasin
MRDTTANVGMTPTSKNSMAASAVATNTSGRQFEMPKIEFPGNLRELAKEAMAQTRGNYEQIETAANEMMSVLVSTQSTAAKSIVNYRAWLMKVAHGNVIAAFDFAQNLATAKSVPDVIEYSRTHARFQFDALAAHTKALTELAHNVATEMAEPIKTIMANAGENAA